jgi:hypothetical protein
MDSTLSSILCYFNAVVFAGMAALAVLRGRTGPGFQVALGVALFFAATGYLAQRKIFWPAVIAWFAAAYAFLWETERARASFGLFDGGIVLFPILLYLCGGLVGSVVTVFDARAHARKSRLEREKSG